MIYIFLAHFVAMHKYKDVLSMNIIEGKVDFKCFYQLFHRPIQYLIVKTYRESLLYFQYASVQMEECRFQTIASIIIAT